MSLLPLVKQIIESLNNFAQQLKSGNLFQPSSLKKWGWKARTAFAPVAFLTIIGVSAFAIQQITLANNPESSIQKTDSAPKSSASNPALSFFTPTGSEYPANWTITSGTTATGTTPSGITVSVATTGNIIILGKGSLTKTNGGVTPSYFPTTTNQALEFQIPNNSVCTPSMGFTGCGTITYSFSEPIRTPVLYVGDIGKGAGGSTWSTFNDAPWTLPSGMTFALDATGSQTTAPPMGIQNSSRSIGINTPTSVLGTTVGSGSCGKFGCGVYDVSGAGSISSLQFSIGYRGSTGTGQGNDNFTAMLGTTPTADLSVTKSSNGPWTVGQSGAQYTLDVANSGLGATSGTVTVRDALPTGITPQWTGTLNTGGFACTFSGQNVTCTTSTAIAVSGTATLTLPVNVTTATTPGSVTNYASIGGGGDAFNSGTAPTAGASCTDATHCASNATTVNSPNLTISKTHTPSTFIRNSTGTYTLTVGNTGTIATSGTITVVDTLPTGLTIPAGAVTEGGANAADWACTAASQTITCTSSVALAASGSSVFNFNVNVASNAAASVTNNVTVSGGNETTANNGNNSASDVTPTILGTDLSITKTNGQTSYYQGQYMVYSIVVTNNGPNASNNAIFTDPSNSDFTVVSVTCGSASGGAACPTVANTTIALMQGAGIVIPTLPSGGSVTFTVAGALKSNVTGSFSNTANIAVPSGVTETNSANNSATDSDFSSGSSTFTACSSGADYVEWTGTYANGTGTVDSTATLIPYLPNLTYTTTGSGGSLALNTAEVMTAASGTDSGWTNLFGSPNGAEITRWHITEPGNITPIVQTITFASATTPNTWGFMIADQDVEQIKIEAYDASGGKYSDAVVSSWYRGVYDADAADSINLPRWLGPTLPYTMGSGANGALPAIPPSTIFASQPASVADTSRASIWFTPTSAVKTLVITYQNLDNATSTDRLYVASCLQPAPTPDLTIAKSHTPTNFTIGSTGTYSFTVNNIGTLGTSGTITVTDTLPTGLTVNGGAAGAITEGGTDAANWTCTSNGSAPQTITCTSSTAIAATGSSVFNFAVNVGASTAVGTNSITNTATVSGGGQTNTANDSASDPTTVVLPTFSCGTMFGVDSNISPSAGIYTLNTSTGAVTAIGVKSVNSLAAAVQPSTGNLYYIQTGSPIQTYVWNTTTGVNTLLSSNAGVSSGSNVRAAFTATDRLFFSNDDNLLIEINPSTGAAISSGTITLASGGSLPVLSGDMAFDGNGNLFYSVGSSLYSIDVITRKATLISVFSGGQTFTGLAFDSLGILYGRATNNNFYRINTNTGGTTLIGATTGLTDLASCSFPTPSLASTKTVAKVAGSGGATISPGDTLEYTITTTNSGNAPATLSTLTDAIPTGTTYVAGSTTINGTAVADVSGVMPYVTAREIHGVSMNSGVIGSDAGVNNVATVVFRVTVNSSSPPTTVSNQGTINFNNGTPVLTDDPTVSGAANPTVSNISLADLTITKSHTGNFTRGSTGTYTLTVSSANAATSGTITVVDTLPTGLSVADGALTLGGTNSANWSCSSTSNVITCTSSTAIAASGSSVFTFSVNVASNAPLSVTNTATVSGGGQTNTANDSSSDVTSIPQTSFGTCDSRMFLSQGPNVSTNTTLYNINTSGNPFTFPTIAQGSTNYNALGFNPSDFYLYGIENIGGSSNHLIRIGADGSTVDLGAVTGLPVGDYNNGDIGSNGILYVRPKASSNLMYAINLSTLTATTITTSISFVAVDLAWIGGKLYTVVNTTGQLISIDPATGTVTNIGAPAGAIQFGAMYGAPNGLFGNDNAGTGFYQIDLVTGTRTLISSSPGAITNDGAHCVDANITFPTDLAVTKDDGKTAYTAGSANVYTMTVTNNGPFGAQNVTVADPLPSGITTASWTCSGTGGGTCAASGTGAINDATVD